MVCTSLGSLLRPIFYFLCSNLKANPVEAFHLGVRAQQNAPKGDFRKPGGTGEGNLCATAHVVNWPLV